MDNRIINNNSPDPLARPVIGNFKRINPDKFTFLTSNQLIPSYINQGNVRYNSQTKPSYTTNSYVPMGWCRIHQKWRGSILLKKFTSTTPKSKMPWERQRQFLMNSSSRIKKKNMSWETKYTSENLDKINCEYGRKHELQGSRYHERKNAGNFLQKNHRHHPQRT